MAARITELVLDCRDPVALAGWWAEVLGWEVVGTEDDGAVEIGPPGQAPKGPVPTLLFAPVPEPTPGKLRLHWDLNATDRDQDAELQRLLELGARPVDVGQGDVNWVVLADPEGNEFCLLQSTVPA
ncbi:VOC family protein [Modestobacter sp. NPDC049651]|uniref:VOC family protein n=1 Tax=unclassified Modestobacter TaxID=2643866 RepID=UPI0033DA113F